MESQIFRRMHRVLLSAQSAQFLQFHRVCAVITQIILETLLSVVVVFVSTLHTSTGELCVYARNTSFEEAYRVNCNASDVKDMQNILHSISTQSRRYMAVSVCNREILLRFQQQKGYGKRNTVFGSRLHKILPVMLRPSKQETKRPERLKDFSRERWN